MRLAALSNVRIVEPVWKSTKTKKDSKKVLLYEKPLEKVKKPTLKLRVYYLDLVLGKNTKYLHWLSDLNYKFYKTT